MLLSPTHTKVWPKLPLGPHVTDFVFREADGEYLLVELERATHLLFKADNGARAPLNHARDQVTDWRRYLEDNLVAIQRELGLEGISANPRSLIVIGRTASLNPANRRKLAAIQSENPRT